MTGEAHTCGARSRATPAPTNALAELANMTAAAAAVCVRRATLALA